jgi:hypothetical protein
MDKIKHKPPIITKIKTPFTLNKILTTNNNLKKLIFWNKHLTIN